MNLYVLTPDSIPIHWKKCTTCLSISYSFFPGFTFFMTYREKENYMLLQNLMFTLYIYLFNHFLWLMTDITCCMCSLLFFLSISPSLCKKTILVAKIVLYRRKFHFLSSVYSALLHFQCQLYHSHNITNSPLSTAFMQSEHKEFKSQWKCPQALAHFLFLLNAYRECHNRNSPKMDGAEDTWVITYL